MSASSKYRIVEGSPRRVFGARQRIVRNAHTLAVQHLDNVPTSSPEVQSWAYDVRRGRLSVYGGILRFIDLLHRKGVSVETALMIPEWLASYIRDVWGTAPAGPKAQMPLELLKTGEHERTAA